MDEAMHFLIMWINMVVDQKKISFEDAAKRVIPLANQVIRDHNNWIQHKSTMDAHGWFDNQVVFGGYLSISRMYREIDMPLDPEDKTGFKMWVED